MHGITIGFGIDSDRINPHFLTRAMNAQGNLATISYKNFFKFSRAEH